MPTLAPVDLRIQDIKASFLFKLQVVRAISIHLKTSYLNLSKCEQNIFLDVHKFIEIIIVMHLGILVTDICHNFCYLYFSCRTTN